MRIFVPLRERAVALVWGGQVLSSVGDELNIAATVWLAAQLWGAGAGYLMAANAACAFVASFVASAVVDDWDSKRTMITSDIVRGVAVASIPVAAYFGAPLGVFLAMAIMVAGSLNPIFESVVVRSVPALMPDPKLLGATNALMATTNRLARILGPGLIVLVGALLPTVHLFSLDALTFVGSALAVSFVARARFVAPPHHHPESKSRGIAGAVALMKEYPIVQHSVITSGLVYAAWSLVFPLGVGLLVHDRSPDDVSALGVVVMAYGVGNLGANLLLGSITVAPEALIFVGRILTGAGFTLMAFAPNTTTLLLCAALAASGGPATDLGFIGTLQARYPARDLARVYRLLLVVSYGTKVALFVASPFLFRRFGTPHVIAMAGVAILVFGVAGYVKHGRTRVLLPSA